MQTLEAFALPHFAIVNDCGARVYVETGLVGLSSAYRIHTHKSQWYRTRTTCIVNEGFWRSIYNQKGGNTVENTSTECALIGLRLGNNVRYTIIQSTAPRPYEWHARHVRNVKAKATNSAVVVHHEVRTAEQTKRGGTLFNPTFVAAITTLLLAYLTDHTSSAVIVLMNC